MPSLTNAPHPLPILTSDQSPVIQIFFRSRQANTLQIQLRALGEGPSIDYQEGHKSLLLLGHDGVLSSFLGRTTLPPKSSRPHVRRNEHGPGSHKPSSYRDIQEILH